MRNSDKAYTVGLHEALGHELPAPGEARPEAESYGYLAEVITSGRPAIRQAMQTC